MGLPSLKLAVQRTVHHVAVIAAFLALASNVDFLLLLKQFRL